MNTSDINTTRDTLVRGPVANLLVAFARNHIQPKRVVAIGRCVNGGGFVIKTGGVAVQPPTDFAEAVAEVDSRPVQLWPTAVHDEIDGERIGAEICEAPHSW